MRRGIPGKVRVAGERRACLRLHRSLQGDRRAQFRSRDPDLFSKAEIRNLAQRLVETFFALSEFCFKFFEFFEPIMFEQNLQKIFEPLREWARLGTDRPLQSADNCGFQIREFLKAPFQVGGLVNEVVMAEKRRPMFSPQVVANGSVSLFIALGRPICDGQSQTQQSPREPRL